MSIENLNVSEVEKVDVLSLKAMVYLLIKSWKLIFFVSFVGFALSVFYVKTSVESYYVSSSILVVKGEDESQLPSGLGVLGALGGEVGGSSDLTQVEFLVEDPRFQMGFIERFNLLPILFYDKWDTINGNWKSDVVKVPDYQDGLKRFGGVVSQTFIPKKNAIKIASRSSSPQIAFLMVQNYIFFLDSVIVHKKQKEARDKIKHLEKRFIESKGMGVNKFEELISAQYEQLILFSESAIDIVVGQVFPREPAGPNKLITVFLFTILSFLSVISYVVLRKK